LRSRKSCDRALRAPPPTGVNVVVIVTVNVCVFKYRLTAAVSTHTIRTLFAPTFIFAPEQILVAAARAPKLRTGVRVVPTWRTNPGFVDVTNVTSEPVDCVTVAEIPGGFGPDTTSDETGADAAATGVTALDPTDAADTPSAFVAVTVKVYGTPFVNPAIVHVRGPVVHTQAAPPGLAVAVYDAIVTRPASTGATHDTTACRSPATPETPVG